MGNFDMLPTEIMLDIFSRVPAGSVPDCKRVSKPWRDVIQQPCFSQMHLNHLNGNFDSGESIFIINTPRLINNQFYCPKWHDPTPFSYTEYDESLNRFTRKRRIILRPPFMGISIVGSCNGLICFKAFDSFNEPNFRPAYICNPITREYIILPELQAGGGHLLTGFGYSPSTDEYKVVSISTTRGCDVQVYTLGSGVGWRKLRRVDYEMVPSVTKLCGAFVNGAIYWVDGKGTVIAFDLADEELRRIPSPPCLPVLVGLGDVLCAYGTYGGGVHIWFLKDSRNNQDFIWEKQFNSHITVRPISLTKSGELLCLDDEDRNVYVCSPKASSSRKLVNFGESEIFSFQVLHKNTLVSLKALGEDDTKLMDACDVERSSGETESSGHIEPRKRKKKVVSINQQKRRMKDI